MGISYFLKGLDNGFGSLFVLSLDFCHDLLIELVLVLLVLFTDKELIFDWLEFFLQELSEFQRIVLDFLLEQEHFLA
jgi:hypothetical protein